MATVAARAPKRDLAPDWRDALRASLKRLALRAWGALMTSVGLAGAVALATHSRGLTTTRGLELAASLGIY